MKCIYCGNEISEGESFCRFCGSAQNVVPAFENGFSEIKPATGKKGGKGALIAVIAVLAVLLLGIAAVFILDMTEVINVKEMLGFEQEEDTKKDRIEIEEDNNKDEDEDKDSSKDEDEEKPSAALTGLDKIGDYTSDNTQFVIGLSGPLTGEAASYGNSVKNGAQLAVDEINNSGGLNGNFFTLVMKDDKATAADASTAYEAMYESGMQVSLGSVTSASAEAFAYCAVEDEVFTLTPSASSDKVIGVSDYSFRSCFGDPDNGILAANELSKMYDNIGVIYDTDDTYSCGIYDAFVRQLENLGVTYAVQTFDAEHNREFTSQVTALKDCDVIFLPIFYTEAGLIAKSCSDLGCNADLFGCDGLEGIKGQIDSMVTNSICYITPFDVNSTDSRISSFVQNYELKYDAKPDQFAAGAYDAVYAIYNAMKVLGVDNVRVDPAELGKALVGVFTSDTFSYSGVTGDMQWNTSGACAKNPIIVEIQ